MFQFLQQDGFVAIGNKQNSGWHLRCGSSFLLAELPHCLRNITLPIIAASLTWYKPIIFSKELVNFSRFSIKIVADELFFMHVGKNSTEKTIGYMISVIDRANDIFKRTNWLQYRTLYKDDGSVMVFVPSFS